MPSWYSRQQLVAAFALLAVTAACSPALRAPERPLSPGDKVEFTLPSAAGPALSSSDLQGKFVILHFWATWCIPCVHELAGLQYFASRLDRQQAEVVLVAVESDWDAVSDYLKLQRITLPCVLDRSGSLRNAFQLSGIPSTFLLDREGNLSAISDPHDFTLRHSVTGPREWASKAVIEQFRRHFAAQQRGAP